MWSLINIHFHRWGNPSTSIDMVAAFNGDKHGSIVGNLYLFNKSCRDCLYTKRWDTFNSYELAAASTPQDTNK